MVSVFIPKQNELTTILIITIIIIIIIIIITICLIKAAYELLITDFGCLP